MIKLCPVLTLLFLASCATKPVKNVEKDLLFSKTWVLEEEKSTPHNSGKRSNKFAIRFSETSATITSLCRYFDEKGEDLKSFFVSASGPVRFSSDMGEMLVEKRISKMESEKVSKRRRKNAKEFQYYECYAELAEGRYVLSFEEKTQSVVLVPVVKPIVLKEQ